MRTASSCVVRATARDGESDSAAAIVAISPPMIANITETTALSTATPPSGRKPPWEVRLLSDAPVSGMAPNSAASMSRTKTMIAATLIEVNQNSNSP